jgi:hypothetical protein
MRLAEKLDWKGLSHPLDIVIFEITYENKAILPDSQTHW